MLDEFDRFQGSADRGAVGFVAIIRIIVAILRRPKLLLTTIFVFGLVGAIVSLNYGWLIPIALVLLAAAFLIFRYVE
jgi:hypothetical protein